MARGSIHLNHRKGCPAKGKDARNCRCSPTVYAIYRSRWQRLDYLSRGWRRSDLDRFEEELGEIRAGRPRRRGDVALGDYAEQWFEELYGAAEAGRVTRSTFNTYEGLWHNHLEPAFGHKPIAAIDQAAIRGYVAEKLAAGLAPVTVNATVTPLSAMLTDAVAEGLIAANPARQPQRARHGGSRRRALYADVERKPPKHLEPVEALALLAATPAGEPREMVLCVLTAGFRRGEVLGLRWEDVDFGRMRIALRGQLQRRQYVGCKCESERDVPLYSGLAQELGKRRRATGYVFTDAEGREWSDSGPERAFLCEAYERAGLRRAGRLWHALRHTYASVLANAGIREDVVAALMGHSKRGTTALYSHLFQDAFEGIEGALAGVFGSNVAQTDEVTAVSTDAHAVTTVPLSRRDSVVGAGP